MDLDDRYGVPVPPGRPRKWEVLHRPTTLARLSDDGGEQFRRLLKSVEASVSLERTAFFDLPILWVIDEPGQFVYAFEDVVDDQTGERLFARPANLQRLAGAAKVGHPALVNGRPARIGGELRLQTSLNGPMWVLTNRSGRYGLNCGRKASQLQNARNDLASLGIEAYILFLQS